MSPALPSLLPAGAIGGSRNRPRRVDVQSPGFPTGSSRPSEQLDAAGVGIQTLNPFLHLHWLGAVGLLRSHDDLLDTFVSQRYRTSTGHRGAGQHELGSGFHDRRAYALGTDGFAGPFRLDPDEGDDL